MFFRREQFLRRHASRLISISLLVAFIAALLPLPVAISSRPEKDRSQPFPCQDHACGCRSAEQCWRQCCCLTQAQKLAWAEAHHVKPPEFVMIAARQESPSKPPLGGCCAPQKKDAAVQSLSRGHAQHCASPAKTCAADRETHPALSNAAPTSKNAPDEQTVVLGLMAQKCQGQVWGWSTLAWAMIPAPLASVMMGAPCPAHRLTQQVESLPLQTLEPPVPPPRLAA